MFSYCKFKNSKRATIDASTNKLKIEHCLFSNNYDGLFLSNCNNVLIQNNSFINNERGISFVNASTGSVKNNVISHNTVTGLNLAYSKPDVSNNTISYNSDAVVATSMMPGAKFQYNDISHNSRAMLIVIDTNLLVSHNDISYNTNVYSSSGIIMDRSFSLIISNIFSYNNSLGSGTALSIGNYSNPLIIFNKISNNYASGSTCAITDNGAGIMVIAHAAPFIVNNLICNNESENQGGGVATYDYGYANIINNTIVNNKTNNTYGGGGGLCIGYGYSEAVLKNNIVWGNEAPFYANQIEAIQLNAIFNVEYCDFMDTINNPNFHSVNYQNLMMSNPLFVNPSAGAGIAYNGLAANWSLQHGSPCINAGTPNTTGLNLYSTDITGSARITGGRVDMGAYEFHGEIIGGINENIEVSGLYLFPNPVNTTLTLFQNKSNSRMIQFTITNSLGEALQTEKLDPTPNYFYKTVDVSGLSKGIYLISVTDDERKVFVKRFVKE